MILHKVSASPFTSQTLALCLTRVAPSDGLLLNQDAVYALQDNKLLAQLAQLSACYVIQNDLDARAVKCTCETIQAISYDEFVQLSLHYNKVLSW